VTEFKLIKLVLYVLMAKKQYRVPYVAHSRHDHKATFYAGTVYEGKNYNYDK